MGEEMGGGDGGEEMEERILYTSEYVFASRDHL